MSPIKLKIMNPGEEGRINNIVALLQVMTDRAAT
jgi:hypothetical protein